MRGPRRSRRNRPSVRPLRNAAASSRHPGSTSGKSRVKRSSRSTFIRSEAALFAFAGLWETWSKAARANQLLHDHHDGRERGDDALSRPYARHPLAGVVRGLARSAHAVASGHGSAPLLPSGLARHLSGRRNRRQRPQRRPATTGASLTNSSPCEPSCSLSRDGGDYLAKEVLPTLHSDASCLYSFPVGAGWPVLQTSNRPKSGGSWAYV